jgi:photosystem II stability/assembly factor-like uncharacterized protein
MADKKNLILGTRKGILVYARSNGGWKLEKEAFSGVNVSYAWHDARTGLLWGSLFHGHFGPKLHRSADGGATWEEVPTPTLPEGATIKEGKPASVLMMWVLAPGGSEGRRILMGTEPGALFSSDDDGATWTLNEALWNQPTRPDKWFGAAAGAAEGPAIHSIWVDPRNADRTLVGISVGGVFETADGGKSWTPRNKGLRADYMPDPDADVGHDPHLLAAAPSDPDVLWQQNHCGVFRSVDGGATWTDVSERDGVVKFGFPVAIDEKRADTAWVVPATSDQCRVPVDRAMCVARTEDGGKTWTALRKGLPQEQCYDIVYRHALDLDGETLVMGSTTGNAWYSTSGGDDWHELGRHLPPINSVRFATL